MLMRSSSENLPGSMFWFIILRMTVILPFVFMAFCRQPSPKPLRFSGQLPDMLSGKVLKPAHRVSGKAKKNGYAVPMSLAGLRAVQKQILSWRYDLRAV